MDIPSNVLELGWDRTHGSGSLGGKDRVSPRNGLASRIAAVNSVQTVSRSPSHPRAASLKTGFGKRRQCLRSHARPPGDIAHHQAPEAGAAVYVVMPRARSADRGPNSVERPATEMGSDAQRGEPRDQGLLPGGHGNEAAIPCPTRHGQFRLLCRRPDDAGGVPAPERDTDLGMSILDGATVGGHVNLASRGA